MATLREALDQIPVILKQRYNLSKFWIPTANKILGEIEPDMEYSDKDIVQNLIYYENVVQYDIPEKIRKLTYVSDPDGTHINYRVAGEKIILSEPLGVHPEIEQLEGNILEIGPTRTWFITRNIWPRPDSDNQLNGMIVRVVSSLTGEWKDYNIVKNEESTDEFGEPQYKLYLDSLLETDIQIDDSVTVYPNFLFVSGFAKLDRFDPTIPEDETESPDLDKDIPLREEWERVLINGLRYYGETQMQATSGEAMRWQAIYADSIDKLRQDNWRNRGFQRQQQGSWWPEIG